jgi:hypothetical protein
MEIAVCSSSPYLCGIIYALVYRIVMGLSSCCVVCVCKRPRLWASESHSDGSFLLCCVCYYFILAHRRNHMWKD